MKTRNRIFFIIGIIIIVIGVGIIIYPIATRLYSEHAQKILMEEAKEQILQSINEANALEPTASPLTGTPPIVTGTADGEEGDPEGSDTEPSDSADDEGSSDILGEDLVYDESEPEEEQPLNSSRLAGQKCIGIITIDSIDLVYAVVEGVKDSNIGVAIGHFPDSAAIGAEGNCALAGHNGGHYSRYFKDIKNLKSGDTVVLTDLSGLEYTYVVYESFIVNPTDVYVVGDLGVSGKYLTMVTCTNGGTQRLVVRAKCTTEPSLMKGVK